MHLESGLKRLLGTTGRQRLVAGIVVVLGLVAVVSMLAGQWSLGAAASVLLLTGGALAALDLRRRSGDLKRRLARQAAATRDLETAVEAGRREVLDSVERVTCDVGQLARQVSAIEEAVAAERDRRADERRRLEALLRRMHRVATEQVPEVEALLQLYGKVSPRGPMPPSGRWALNPTGLLNLYALVEKQGPALVIELGSGTSTVWLGYAVAQHGDGRVVSVDHLPDYAEQTRAAVDLHGLSTVSEVRDAPLTETQVGDETYQWYEPSVLSDLDQIDLLFVDGPPGATGHDARYPAVPLLLDRLADGALIVLDDIDRADEQQIVERWLKHTPGLSREPTVVGDQAVLRYRPVPADEPDAGGR